MDRISTSGPAASDVPDAPAEGRKRHFDTFETQFFKQGDDAENPREADRFEDLDDGAGRSRVFLPSWQLALVAGGVCVLVIGCVALWRGTGRSTPLPDQPAVVVSPPPAPAATAREPIAPAAPTQVAVAAGAAVPVAVAKSEPPASAAAPAAEEPAPGTRQPEARPAEVADSAAARARCKQAVSLRHGKEIQSACADIAVLLAKIELDKGRSAQAAAWGRKALAADPNAADAYVFIGGAEQSAGHNKAAKEAYKRYLQLAPGGRYAGDLRAIVGSL